VVGLCRRSLQRAQASDGDAGKHGRVGSGLGRADDCRRGSALARLVFAFVFGLAAAMDAPVRQTFVAELVGDEDLPSAVSLNSTSYNAARMVGPAAADLVIATVGTGWAFLMNGISFGRCTGRHTDRGAHPGLGCQPLRSTLGARSGCSIWLRRCHCGALRHGPADLSEEWAK
jgi:MFS family permease